MSSSDSGGGSSPESDSGDHHQQQQQLEPDAATTAAAASSDDGGGDVVPPNAMPASSTASPGDKRASVSLQMTFENSISVYEPYDSAIDTKLLPGGGKSSESSFSAAGPPPRSNASYAQTMSRVESLSVAPPPPPPDDVMIADEQNEVAMRGRNEHERRCDLVMLMVIRQSRSKADWDTLPLALVGAVVTHEELSRALKVAGYTMKQMMRAWYDACACDDGVADSEQMNRDQWTAFGHRCVDVIKNLESKWDARPGHGFTAKGLSDQHKTEAHAAVYHAKKKGKNPHKEVEALKAKQLAAEQRKKQAAENARGRKTMYLDSVKEHDNGCCFGKNGFCVFCCCCFIHRKLNELENVNNDDADARTKGPVLQTMSSGGDAKKGGSDGGGNAANTKMTPKASQAKEPSASACERTMPRQSISELT